MLQAKMEFDQGREVIGVDEVAARQDDKEENRFIGFYQPTRRMTGKVVGTVCPG